MAAAITSFTVGGYHSPLTRSDSGRGGSAGATVAEYRQEVSDRYNDAVDAAHERMIWTAPGFSTLWGSKTSARPWLPGPA
jgi:hypothetical protein